MSSSRTKLTGRQLQLIRRRAELAFEHPAYIRGLHPKQKAFVLDPSRHKAALCSRRAGKSHAIAAWLLYGAKQDPGGLSVYVARSRNNARLILWTALEEIRERYGLDLWFREIDGQLMVECENRHRIWCAGAKDQSEIGKFRGPKYKRVAIDEAQEYGSYLIDMVSDVFQPALIDKKGDMVLAGTPAPVPAGLFYMATTGDGAEKWPTHSWTMSDNPFIDSDAEIERIKQGYGWDDDHPRFRREYLGQWVRDTGALVYPFDSNLNLYRELPDGAWSYAMGVDLGYEDSTAFVVGAFRKGHPEMYVVKTEKRTGMIPSAVAAYVEKYRREYNLGRIVVDTGGFGKGYAEELRQSYGIGVESAEKTKKRAYQELVAGDLRSGTIKLHPFECRELVEEMQVLQWDERHEKEDEKFENHATDAFLYLCRALRPWYQPEEAEPKPGTREYENKERLKARKAAQAEVRRRVKLRGRYR